MEIIVGTIVTKGNSVLMVKENKQKCFGKWNFPSGHLEENENLFQGAQRETKEETGCEVKLKKVFPIINSKINEKNIIIIYFLAEVTTEVDIFHSEEIMQTKWMTIEELKNIKNNEMRSCVIKDEIVKNLENNNLYPLTIINNLTTI